PEGHHRFKVRLNAQGKMVEESFFGPDGEPVVTTRGYHCMRRRYDARGLKVEEVCFGAAGEPAFASLGNSFRALFSYNAQGRSAGFVLLGPNGRPRNNKQGVARMQISYDPLGAKVGSTAWRADPQGRLRLWKRLDGKGKILENANLDTDGTPGK